jgi:hypothetical protein
MSEMKTNDTLVKDVLGVLDSKSSFVSDAEDIAKLVDNLAFQVIKGQQEHTKVRDEKVIYASEVGEPCHRKLWYKIHYPEKGEYIREETRLKFLYGDVLEEVLLYLAKTSGHSVSHQQASIVEEFEDGWQVRGRIDAVIDGEIVDVKTASPYGYTKMVEDGLTRENDSFGYSGQLGFYQRNKDQLEGVQVGDDPKFLVMDKQNGKVGIGRPVPGEVDIQAIIDEVKDDAIIPDRGFKSEKWTNGNEKLGVNCSYCPFKKDCWPGLRVFDYSRGPVFATNIRKVPRNAEITTHWKRTSFKESK